MPLNFERDDARRRLVLTGRGHVTVGEWTDSIARAIADGAWHYATLYDFTAPNSFLPGATEGADITKAAMQLQQEHGQRGPVAFAVADPSEYHHTRGWVDSVGARMPWRVELFRTRQDAERWLDALG